MRLIDADELKMAIVSNLKKASPHFFKPFEYVEIIDIIESQPTVKLKLTVDNMPRYTHNMNEVIK